MKVLVIGSGGREHALCWKLKQSKKVTEIYCAPGNPGTATLATNVALKVDDLTGLVDFASSNAVDLTVVGPEYPLSLGIVDLFRGKGLKIFGPSKDAARLESSKSFAKEIMAAARVKTAVARTVTDLASAEAYLSQHGAPIVLKSDGLAAGKGVVVCQTAKEANEAAHQLFKQFPNSPLLMEDFLEGKEASLIVVTNGKQIFSLASAHDYKRVSEGDSGPNTGGMGTVSPTDHMSAAQEAQALEQVIVPVVEEMNRRGTPFSGFLYAGLMISPKGDINVLEFNARMGDPECQSIMRRMNSDLFELLYGLSCGDKVAPPKWHNDPAICVVIAAEGYPGEVTTGDEILGIRDAESEKDIVVFHAGTALDSKGRLVAAGGRVLGVTCSGAELPLARTNVYRACSKIQLRGSHFRRDIGQ